MRVLIFGTGQFYNKYSSVIYEHEEVVGLLDNNPDKWNTVCDGVMIFNPNNIEDVIYDKIILLSYYGVAMHKQMVSLGIPSEKLMYWNEYFSFIMPNKKECINIPTTTKKKRILIITTELNYNGGTIAAVYMAMALINMGYNVVIASPRANEVFLNEYIGRGFSFIICPSLPYVDRNNLNEINDFDIVIVNVLQMIQCACEISQVKPTIWWIHESDEKYDSVYPDTLYQFQRYADGRYFKKIKILAVSNIAKNNFTKHFSNINVEIMNYGIPDEIKKNNKKEKEALIFAVIGSVTKLKAQDIFIEAANKLCDSDVECWIIGGTEDSAFYNSVYNMSCDNLAIKFLGLLTREQMNKIYNEIDVIVCSSRAETMSLTITEGMMHEKACIVSDNAGMAEFVDDGINGFTFKSGNSIDLYSKMKWCVDNRSELKKIGINARKTYEDNFTLGKFGERLEKVINKCF